MSRYAEYTDHPYTLSKRAPYTHMREVVTKYVWLRLGSEKLFTGPERNMRNMLFDFKTVIEGAISELFGPTARVSIQVTFSPPAPVEVVVGTEDSE